MLINILSYIILIDIIKRDIIIDIDFDKGIFKLFDFINDIHFFLFY